MRPFQLLILLLFIIIPSASITATNYHVSNSGDDNNNGLSLANAFLTIQHAGDIAVAGDTVFVENGTYVGFDLRNNSGSMGNPIVFKANGINVLINQHGPLRNDGINIEGVDFIIIDGFISNNMPGSGNGIRVVLADNCIIRNCACDNNGERGIFTAFTDDIIIEYNVCTNSIDEHGIYVSNSSDRPIIRYNECYGNNSIGIHMNGDLSAGGDGIISDAQVYGNMLHDNNGAAGINMDGLENPIVYNNLIYNNHFSQGIALFQQDGAIVTKGAKIFNNTIIVPSDGRWGILVQDGANINTVIYNNIIINQHAWRGCIAIENATQFTSDFNILNDKMSNVGDGSTISLADWQALGFDTLSQLAGSLVSIFENPALNNYQLVVGSQAIDNGTNLVNTIVTDDIIGNARPNGTNYDIGAYEFSENCPSFLHLTGIQNVDKSYQAADTIISNATIQNAIINYKAGEVIILQSGFIVEVGAVFSAKIESCTQPLLENIPILKKIKNQNNLPNPLVQNIDFQVFPNPFKNQTSIQFLTFKSEKIQLNLYDINGVLVKIILPLSTYSKGLQQLTMHVGDLQAGVYYLSLETQDLIETKKLVIGR